MTSIYGCGYCGQVSKNAFVCPHCRTNKQVLLVSDLERTKLEARKFKLMRPLVASASVPSLVEQASQYGNCKTCPARKDCSIKDDLDKMTFSEQMKACRKQLLKWWRSGDE